MENEKWKLVGYILASKFRYMIMEYLNNQNSLPSKISVDLNLHLGHTSNLLKGLRDKGLIRCLNPELKKGRIYNITDKGVEMLEEVKKLV